LLAGEGSEFQDEPQTAICRHQNMKKTWPIFLILLLLAAPVAVQAQFTYTNADGSIYNYSTNADGVSLTITRYTGPPWAVTIPTNINGLTVTNIGTSAFYDLTNLTSINIPGSVTNIGQEAFEYCTDLTNATIDNGVTSIGADAFESCTKLTSVTLPSTITSIGVYAFEYCSKLTNFMVETNNPAYSSVNGVLFDITQSTLVEYPPGLGGSYTIPASVTIIGPNAFYYCTNLTSITIPGSVTNIGGEAFFACAYLSSITIPGGVTSIGVSAFQNCFGLSNVTMSNGIVSIGPYAFYDCTKLTSITIPGSVTNIGLLAFESCTKLTNATIDNGVPSIGAEAFYGCYDLTSVTIPASVTNIGNYAFEGCTSLSSVYFQGNAPTADSTVFAVFNPSGYAPATAYYLPGTTGWSSTFADIPTALWSLPNPMILNNGPSLGVQGNAFGFTISWATNVSVVVEAATNLANSVWIPLQTNTLTNGSFYFSDPQWTNFPGRFYRISAP
jgi:hypothetical protein